MAGDAVLTVLPSAATGRRVALFPAKFVTPAFQGSGWDGPGLTVTFNSAAPPLKVYAFFAQRAKSTGWAVRSSGSRNVPDMWAKVVPNCGSFLLQLSDLGDTAATRPYVLTVSGIDPPPAGGC